MGTPGLLQVVSSFFLEDFSTSHEDPRFSSIFVLEPVFRSHADGAPPVQAPPTLISIRPHGVAFPSRRWFRIGLDVRVLTLRSPHPAVLR